MNRLTVTTGKSASRSHSSLRASALLLVLLPTINLSAQQTSLADVARQEAERRKAVTQPSKIYTNADLRPDALSVPPSAVSSSQWVDERQATDAEHSTSAAAQVDAPLAHGADYCELCGRDGDGRIVHSEAALRRFMRGIGVPTIWQAPVPIIGVPIVLPPSCGTNTPREQAMSGYMQAAGFGGPAQTLPPCPAVRPAP